MLVVLVAEVARWSDENLTMEGSSWYISALWIHERRLHGGIEQLLSLLAVTGNESGLGEGCVRGSFEGRRVPTSNW